jgi:YHS domain-containing protein
MFNFGKQGESKMKKTIGMILSVGMLANTGTIFASDDGYGSYGKSSQKAASAYAEKKAAIDGNCTVCLVEMNSLVKGTSQHSLEYNGKTYLFPAEKQMRMFQKNPKKYTQNIEEKYHAMKDAQGSHDQHFH